MYLENSCKADILKSFGFTIASIGILVLTWFKKLPMKANVLVAGTAIAAFGCRKAI